MKTDEIPYGTPEESKNPYVRLERFDLTEINGYRPKPETDGEYFIYLDSEKSNVHVDDNMVSLDLVSEIFGDNGKCFRSYVLLERLSPHDIRNLLNKKD